MQMVAQLESIMTRCHWDVVVVGAGPAGSVAAGQMARLGASVLLIDKSPFPRTKVCGCCINRAALATLEKIGLGDLPRQLGARPIHEIQLFAPRSRSRVPLPAGVALCRRTFDMALVEQAVASGASFEDQTGAVLVSGQAGPVRRLLLRRPSDRSQTVEAKLIVAADGLAGTLLSNEPGMSVRIGRKSRMGISAIIDSPPDFYRPGTIYMACGRRGYVGLVCLAAGRLDMAAAVDPEYLKRSGGPAPALRCILRQVHLPAASQMASTRWRGTPLLTRRRRRVAGHRLFVLGDAAGYVEPFTGEGIAWALASAFALAPLAAQGVRQWDDSLITRWTTLHRNLIGRRQRSCRLVTRLLRQPALTSTMVRALSIWPHLARPVIHSINIPIGQRTRQATTGRTGPELENQSQFRMRSAGKGAGFSAVPN